MRYLLIILLFFSNISNAQIISFIWHGDTLWARNPLNTDSVQVSNKAVPWGSVSSKPSLFDGTWASLTGKPTISGSNTGDQDLSGYSLTSHSHTFASITSPPTTVAGYGITDAPKIVAAINATAQAANIGTATLYAVPSAGFYRVSIYITVTQAATTSSTMPSTTIAYTDGNSGTNAHSTTTTATNASNSVTTSFAQTTYVLYAKASTNITYATGSYASSGATPMQYALRIRVEAL